MRSAADLLQFSLVFLTVRGGFEVSPTTYFLPRYSSSLTGAIHVAVPTLTAIWTSP